MRFSFCKGQSLIEVIVSVGIAVILAIALISAGLVSNKTARSARNNTQATKLAEQNIEQIRVFRDRKGFTALTNNACYQLDTSNADPASWILTPKTTCPPGGSGAETVVVDNTITFYRTLAVGDTNPVDPNKKLITATVSWNESGGMQTVTSQTILSMWSSL